MRAASAARAMGGRLEGWNGPGGGATFRVRLPAGNAVADLKARLRGRDLVTVCEEASCPNIHECFAKGTATFMILGEVCTRRCSFCDVAHGRPLPPDDLEQWLKQTVLPRKAPWIGAVTEAEAGAARVVGRV